MSHRQSDGLIVPMMADNAAGGKPDEEKPHVRI